MPGHPPVKWTQAKSRSCSNAITLRKQFIPPKDCQEDQSYLFVKPTFWTHSQRENLEEPEENNSFKEKRKKLVIVHFNNNWHAYNIVFAFTNDFCAIISKVRIVFHLLQPPQSPLAVH